MAFKTRGVAFFFHSTFRPGCRQRPLRDGRITRARSATRLLRRRRGESFFSQFERWKEARIAIGRIFPSAPETSQSTARDCRKWMWVMFCIFHWRAGAPSLEYRRGGRGVRGVSPSPRCHLRLEPPSSRCESADHYGLKDPCEALCGSRNNPLPGPPPLLLLGGPHESIDKISFTPPARFCDAVLSLL